MKDMSGFHRVYPDPVRMLRIARSASFISACASDNSLHRGGHGMLRRHSTMVSTNSSALLEIRGDGEESMWFAWGSNTSLEFAPSWGGGVRHYIGHRPMVAKAFQAGKLQAIVRAEDGTVFVLQSYLTQKKDVSGNWISMFPGSSTDPGEDADVCAYFASCCSSLPATWQAQCGYLASTVACGVSTCSGNVTLDDQRGEWCEVQAGDTPDVCSGTYGEPTCGCPGTPPCSEYGSGVRRLTKSDTPWPASGHFDIQIVA
eukprot:TRINITY_DN8322_c0_g1_i2.p1 TRINITY_DN8322_c0_g1~~TRINITY_DN8322_c0_g1_i2.p1  ORF type:complete len:258 (-),score=10.09 TRINITY_DN8322_c0_g1_i2:223-996(-)